MFLQVDLNQFLEIVIFSSMSKLLCKKFKLKLSCPDKFEHSVVRVGFRLSADSFKLCNLVMINLNFVKKAKEIFYNEKLFAALKRFEIWPAQKRYTLTHVCHK